MGKGLIIRCRILFVAAVSGAIGFGAGARAEPSATPDFIDTRPLPPNDRRRPDDADARRKASAEADVKRQNLDADAARKAPDGKTQLAKSPETKSPETKLPETKLPETKQPEAKPQDPKPEMKALAAKAEQPIAPAGVAAGAPAGAVSSVATAAVSTGSTPSKSPDAERYVARGRNVLATGDVTAARAFFERALNAGVPDAAIELAGTYDPIRLKELGVVGLRADPARAAELYRQAVAMGAADAGQRLRRLTDAQ